MLIAELKRETSERLESVESLRGANRQLTEDFASEREERLNVQRQEQERALVKGVPTLGGEAERQEHKEMLRRAEGLEREQQRSSV
jgi:hypothetical protein